MSKKQPLSKDDPLNAFIKQFETALQKSAYSG